MLAHLCAASRALLVGLLVGLLACHEVGPTIRVGTERAEIVVHALDAPDQHVEVAPAAFMEAVGVSGGMIVPVAGRLEHARRLMGYPGRQRTEGPLRIVLASWPPAVAPDPLTLEYGAWCAGARHLAGDCLSLLEGPSLNEDGRVSLALTFAFGKVLDETAAALKRTVNPEAIRAMIVTSIAMYLMLWLLPEPVSKGIAAVLTAGLMAYLGAWTVWSMIRGWRQLVKEARAATSLGDLRESGHRFGEIIGENSARVFVMLASATLASTLGTVLQSGTLPGAAQAAQIGASQGGFRLAAVTQVEGIAVAAEGELTITLAPVAVAMAPAKSGGGAAEREEGGSIRTPSSAGKMQREVERGQAPKEVDRVDKGRGPFEKDHVHFGEGEKSPALNNDGTWKHNPTPIPKAVQEWLTAHGWKLPE